MALATRGIAVLKAAVAKASAAKAPAAKASSRAKTSNRSKVSSKSKSANRAKSTSKPTQKATPTAPAAPTAPVAVEVPETPSPGTVTPDLIEEIDVETLNNNAAIRRLIQSEVAKARDVQPSTSHTSRADAYRVRKSRSHRRHRRSRRYSYSSGVSTDSEEGDRPPVSFLHHKEGTRPFLDLAGRFPMVQIKYFKQIFFETFQPENLTKLGQGMADRATTEAPQDAKGVAHMLLCLEIYGQIVLHFSNVSIRGPLQESLSKYRVRLIEMSVIYKFDSIKAYNATFMRTRILRGQDDPKAWACEDRLCCDLLVRKLGPSEASKPPTNGSSKPFSSGQGICRNFREGEHVSIANIATSVSTVSKVTQPVHVGGLRPRPLQPTPLRSGIGSPDLSDSLAPPPGAFVTDFHIGRFPIRIV